jgi:hypothetical protein
MSLFHLETGSPSFPKDDHAEMIILVENGKIFLILGVGKRVLFDNRFSHLFEKRTVQF